MTREEFEKQLDAFLEKAVENGYGIEYAAWIKKCEEEDYAAATRGELPMQCLSSLDPNMLFSYDPKEEVTADDLEMLSLCWQYLEFYPETDEENVGRIKGIRPDAPDPARESYAAWRKRRDRREQKAHRY